VKAVPTDSRISGRSDRPTRPRSLARAPPCECASSNPSCLRSPEGSRNTYQQLVLRARGEHEPENPRVAVSAHSVLHYSQARDAASARANRLRVDPERLQRSGHGHVPAAVDHLPLAAPRRGLRADRAWGDERGEAGRRLDRPRPHGGRLEVRSTIQPTTSRSPAPRRFRPGSTGRW